MNSEIPEPTTAAPAATGHLQECQRLIRALARSEAQFRSLFECCPDGVFVEDVNGFVLDANPAACEMHGILRERMIGMHVSELVPAELRLQVTDLQAKLVNGQLRQFDSCATKADGSVMPTDIRSTPFDYAGTAAVLLVVRDVTELRRAQAAERQCLIEKAHLSRLTIMGEIVAGIVHELKQPLWAINNFASACQTSLEDPQRDLTRVSDWLGCISQQATRAGDIIRRMISFARKSEPRNEVVELAAVLRESIDIVEPSAAPRDITIELQLGNERLFVQADSVAIQQTVVNLLTNACAALDAVTSQPRRIVVTTVRRAGFAEVAVRDNGPGLPNVEADKLFEAFFTTRPDGLGLGLVISKGLIDLMGGELWTTRPAEGGARFHFTLPLAEFTTQT